MCLLNGLPLGGEGQVLPLVCGPRSSLHSELSYQFSPLNFTEHTNIPFSLLAPSI